MKRGIHVALLATLLLAAMAAPAAATKPDPGADLVDGHKITICHATRSLSNPYVEITIDIAAWNDQTDDKNHGDHHTRTKNGETWSDYILEDGEECSIGDQPDPEPLLCYGREVDFIVEFSGDQLVSTQHHRPGVVRLTETVAYDIPAGTYELILVSTDSGKRKTDQTDERWRAVFSEGSASEYTPDLPDGLPPPIVTSDGGTVTFDEAVDSVTAEHWDVMNTSDSPDSVVPLAVCLVEDGLSL